jgi:hypothetical protein
MRIKTKTKGQKIADTMTVEKFMNELSSSFVGKLFEGENGEPDTILLMQKYLDEGRGSSLEQILMSRAIGELIKVRQEMANLTNPATCFKMGVKEEEADRTLSVQNILDICREDEQNQLAEMLHLQDEANFNNEQFNNNKGDMK